MARHELRVHEVEYLSVTSVTITEGDPPAQRPTIIITIRPDRNSFRPHNLSIARSQAETLLDNLRSVLSRSAVCLLLLLAGAAGCSSEIEIEEETTTPAGRKATVTKERTRVAVDLLTDREMVMEDGQAIETPSDGVLMVEGCLHIHETLIIHLKEDDRASERTAIEIVREWASEGCERHRRK